MGKKKKNDKSVHGGKRKKKKTKKTGRIVASEEKLKGAKLARKGETSSKLKKKKGFSPDDMLKRML